MTRAKRTATADEPLSRDGRKELERLMVKARELERANDALRPRVWSVARSADAAREECWLLEEQVKEAEAGTEAGLGSDREETLQPPSPPPGKPVGLDLVRLGLHAMAVALLGCAVAVKSVESHAQSDALFLVLAAGSAVWLAGWFIVALIEGPHPPMEGGSEDPDPFFYWQ